MAERGMVIVLADAPDSGEDEWVLHVEGEHWARHADLGFSGFRHYVNMPGHPDIGIDVAEPPDHLFVFETPDVSITAGDGYRQLTNVYGKEPWSSLNRGSHGVYEQIFQYPPADDYAFGDSKHIFFSGADCPAESAEEYNAYYNTEHIPLVFDLIPGFVTGRRFKSGGESLPSTEWLDGLNTTHLAFYDIESEQVFKNPIFLTFTPTPWQIRMGGIRVLRSNSIFREVHRAEA